MRTYALIAVVCAVILVANFASAQQADVMLGGGTLLSSSPQTATQDQTVIAEKGAPYPSASADIILFRRYGLNVEGAWKWKDGYYPGYEQGYRPILVDGNVLFQPRLSRKFGIDLMVGAGAESVRFYSPATSSCPYASCTTFFSNSHFMEHLGGGIRYYFYRHLYVRPEVHYYHIHNNTEFNSDNVVRAGASVGYTFGR
ncbi:MAG TPA: hypothetical protein VIW68_06240 [Candidatus Sulfotelmatobacter sp.]